MAVCLEYQTIYLNREERKASVKWQITAALFLIIALVTKLTVRHQLTQAKYELGHEIEVTTRLERQKAALTVDYSVLSRPDRLRSSAERVLHLSVPLPSQRIRTQEGRE
jgi:Cell division protein FtsL